MIKLMKHHWHWRRHKFYRKTRWHLVLDLALGVIIIMLVAAVLTMHYYQPDLSSLLSFNPNKAEKIDLDNPPLELSSSVLDNSFINGESILLEIDLDNSYSKDVKNAKLTLIPSNDFSIIKIEMVTENQNIEISNEEISLKLIEAGQSEDVNLLVHLQAYRGQKTLKWDAQLEYVINGQIIKDSFSLNNLSIISELAVSSVAYYNSPQSDQLGAGPIPPIAYLPTNYWIFWNVKPDGNFKDFVMSAQLPRGVELTDNQSLLAGELNYNSSSRRVVWQIKDLHLENSTYRIGFEVQLIPEEEQVGKILPLILGAKYYAHDALSNKEVAEQVGKLTTNLDYDRINKGHGRVVNQ